MPNKNTSPKKADASGQSDLLPGIEAPRHGAAEEGGSQEGGAGGEQGGAHAHAQRLLPLLQTPAAFQGPELVDHNLTLISGYSL